MVLSILLLTTLPVSKRWPGASAVGVLARAFSAVGFVVDITPYLRARARWASTVFTRAMFLRTFANWSGFAAWPVARCHAQIELLLAQLQQLLAELGRAPCLRRLLLRLHARTCRFTNAVDTESFAQASRNASRAISSLTPSISNSTLPGCTLRDPVLDVALAASPCALRAASW